MEENNKVDIVNVETNAVYIMALAFERILNDIEDRFKLRRKAFRFDKKMRFSSIINSIKAVKRDVDIIDTVDFAEGLKKHPEHYQYYQEDAYDLVRVILLIADRQSRDSSVVSQVESFLEGKPGMGIVTADVLQRFILR